MSWGDTLILVISRGVQLYYGIAHYCYTIYFNESTVLLTSTTNQPTVPLTYPWTASLPMMALATDLTRDMLRRLYISDNIMGLGMAWLMESREVSREKTL